VTSLFFHIISGNFNALVPSLLQLLYTSLVEEFILPLKKDFHIRNDVIVIRKMCATEVFFQQWEQTEVGGCYAWRIWWMQQTSQQQRCGQARYHATEELHLAAFFDACFSMLHVIYVVQQHNMRLNRGAFWQIICHHHTFTVPNTAAWHSQQIGVTLNFLGVSELACLQTILCHFVSGSKWWTHV